MDTCKRFHRLLKNIGKLTDDQCSVSIQETNNDRFFISLQVLPNDGPYKGGKFDFVIKLCYRFPSVAPDLRCLTPIFHPNIDDCGEICLSLLDEWTCDNTLEDCVQGILFLLYNPNLEDPLSPYFCPEDADDMELFYKNVRISMEGGTVEGVEFKRNLVEEKPNYNEGEISICPGVTQELPSTKELFGKDKKTCPA